MKPVLSSRPVMSDSRYTEAQSQKFADLACTILANNSFYRSKFAEVGYSQNRIPDIEELSGLPFTYKDELVADQQHNPVFGTNLSFPVETFCRVHRTSGTSGKPLMWLDTVESWQWWLDCWRAVYSAAGVEASDRVFVAFSFGPFIGFWTAFEAGQQLGAMMLPGGGLSSEQRLGALLDLDATVLVCTPTYALRLAEVAKQTGLNLHDSSIRLTIHAGEPGASIPSVRQRLESAWGARVFDHAGATEVGAWGFSCGVNDHMHVNEDQFVAEVVNAEGDLVLQPGDDGLMSGELVLTNLGRLGSPVLRYRTGDAVHLSRGSCACGSAHAYLEGGVVGRLDDMFIVRGINVYPSAIEDIVREFDEIEEFQIEVEKATEMAELLIRIEVDAPEPAAIAEGLAAQLRQRLSFRPRVVVAEPASLPRFELKARRIKYS